MLRAAAAVLALGLLWALVGASCDRTSDEARVLVPDAAFPAAIAPLPDGGFVYGERLTGAIRYVDAGGRLDPEPVQALLISTDGEQRGLLGLAVSPDERLFASWTDPERDLVVGEVARIAGGEFEALNRLRLIWRGPQTADRSNGGRIAFAPDGRLVIGVGDLLLGDQAAADPERPYGKMLSLDPNSGFRQNPIVLSGSWNNPFAFTYTPGGALWVADNSGGDAPERLARGDAGATAESVTEVPAHTVASGLVATSNDRLLLCSYLLRTLQPYRIGGDGLARPDGPPLVDDCSIGVAQLSDGTIVYANETEIRALEPIG